MTEILVTPQGRRLAFDRMDGDGPGIMFLGGFKSDKEGTKAVHLENWAKQRGRAFVRFDYSGHGQSSGAFTDGSISDWAEDAMVMLDWMTTGPQILVGSSMGGWIAVLLARARPERLAGLVGIAAAPDFTEDSMWAGFSDDQRATLQRDGQIELPSEYDGPYVITRHLIEDGRWYLVLRAPLPVSVPVRLLQGTADVDVDRSVALRLLDTLEGDDVRLTLLKGADHRFSTPGCLALIETAIDEVSG